MFIKIGDFKVSFSKNKNNKLNNILSKSIIQGFFQKTIIFKSMFGLIIVLYSKSTRKVFKNVFRLIVENF